jgi:hypothetical protein
MSSDFDARDFQTSSFYKKEDLRLSGPVRLTIKAVEQTDGLARNGQPARKVLQLVSVDDKRLSLGTQANLRRLIEFFGEKTSRWVGQTVEAYYSPDVRSPSGAEGGIRLRLPDGDRSPVSPLDFSDLGPSVKGGVQ